MDDLKNTLITIGSNALLFLLVLAAGIGAAKILTFALKKIFIRAKGEKTAKTFLLSCASVLLYTAAVLLALSVVGVDVTSIVTAAGVASVVAGLALQNTLSNLVSGFILLASKPFSAGDLIEFDGYEGYVESVNVFFTTLRQFDNKIVKIPNSRLTSNDVVNCSAGETRRVKATFTVSYDDNLTKVKSVIYGVIAKDRRILTSPEPSVLIGEHLDSGVRVIVLAWGKTEDYYGIYHGLQEAVKLAFDENGITIPYPHVEIVDGDKTDKAKTQDA